MQNLYTILQGLFVTCFKRRGNYIQTVILLLIVDKIIFEFVFLTEGTITYIFTKEKFNWNADNYSTFKAVANTLRAVGTLLVTPMLKIMGVSDPFICFLGFLSSALYSYFTGLSMAPWILWMAAALGCVRSMTSAVARSHKIPSNNRKSLESISISDPWHLNWWRRMK